SSEVAELEDSQFETRRQVLRIPFRRRRRQLRRRHRQRPLLNTQIHRPAAYHTPPVIKVGRKATRLKAAEPIQRDLIRRRCFLSMIPGEESSSAGREEFQV